VGKKEKMLFDLKTTIEVDPILKEEAKSDDDFENF